MTYKVQIDDLIRNANSAEVELIEIIQADKIAEEQALLEKTAIRDALLQRLGITAEEASLLLG